MCDGFRLFAARAVHVTYRTVGTTTPIPVRRRLEKLRHLGILDPFGIWIIFVICHPVRTGSIGMIHMHLNNEVHISCIAVWGMQLYTGTGWSSAYFVGMGPAMSSQAT